jgi:hypothetical protein
MAAKNEQEDPDYWESRIFALYENILKYGATLQTTEEMAMIMNISAVIKKLGRNVNPIFKKMRRRKPDVGKAITDLWPYYDTQLGTQPLSILLQAVKNREATIRKIIRMTEHTAEEKFSEVESTSLKEYVEHDMKRITITRVKKNDAYVDEDFWRTKAIIVSKEHVLSSMRSEMLDSISIMTKLGRIYDIERLVSFFTKQLDVVTRTFFIDRLKKSLMSSEKRRVELQERLTGVATETEFVNVVGNAVPFVRIISYPVTTSQAKLQEIIPAQLKIVTPEKKWTLQDKVDREKLKTRIKMQILAYRELLKEVNAKRNAVGSLFSYMYDVKQDLYQIWKRTFTTAFSYGTSRSIVFDLLFR